MPKISRRPFFIFVLSVVVIILMVFLHLVGILQPAEALFFKIILPFEKGASQFGKRIGSFFSFFSQIKNLSKENKKLDEENKKLLQEVVKLKETEKENNLLREQLVYVGREERKLLPAFIVSFDPYYLLRSVVLNRGENDKVRKEMAVVAYEGILVGQIQEVLLDTSKVLLITDGHSKIPAQIQGTRADGVVFGEHGLGLVMEMIPQDQVIRRGDIVITSSLSSSKIPSGLAIGEVEEVSMSKNELFQKARIKSPVDFKRLESVYIVLE